MKRLISLICRIFTNTKTKDTDYRTLNGKLWRNLTVLSIFIFGGSIETVGLLLRLGLQCHLFLSFQFLKGEEGLKPLDLINWIIWLNFSNMCNKFTIDLDEIGHVMRFGGPGKVDGILKSLHHPERLDLCQILLFERRFQSDSLLEREASLADGDVFFLSFSLFFTFS